MAKSDSLFSSFSFKSMFGSPHSNPTTTSPAKTASYMAASTKASQQMGTSSWMDNFFSPQGLAGASLVLEGLGAFSQIRQAGLNAQVERNALAIEEAQANAEYFLRAEQIQRDTNKALGNIVATSAARGVRLTGSVMDLIRQAEADSELKQNYLKKLRDINKIAVGTRSAQISATEAGQKVQALFEGAASAFSFAVERTPYKLP